MVALTRVFPSFSNDVEKKVIFHILKGFSSVACRLDNTVNCSIILTFAAEHRMYVFEVTTYFASLVP